MRLKASGNSKSDGHLPKESYVIRTVADLAALSDADLAACMRGLRDAINVKKKARAAAVHAGKLPPDSPLQFEEYVWSPRRETGSKWSAEFSPTTPLKDLPIPTLARFKLEDEHILCLEDLSTITETAFGSLKDIGPTMVLRIRELLQAHGMDFAKPTNPEVNDHQRSRDIRRLPPELLVQARAGLADSEPIASLGLSSRTLDACRRRDVKTIGQLRDATWRQLNIAFGYAALRELVRVLKETGEGLRCNPTQAQLYQARVLDASELIVPTADATPLWELSPWIGNACTQKLLEVAIYNLGELRQAEASGALKGIRGIGDSARERISAFLGGKMSQDVAPAAGATHDVTRAPANSVFAWAGAGGAPAASPDGPAEDGDHVG